MVFWIGIAAVVVFIASIWLDKEGGILSAAAAVAGFALVIVGGAQVVTSDGQASDCRTGLAALTNTTSQEGSFGMFLGIGGGSFSEDQKIVYMSEDERGGVSIGSIPADRAVIYEDGKQYMECRVKTATYNIHWAWPFGEPKVSSYNTSTYEFHVPEGSVVRNFSVDLANS